MMRYMPTVAVASSTAEGVLETLIPAGESEVSDGSEKRKRRALTLGGASSDVDLVISCRDN